MSAFDAQDTAQNNLQDWLRGIVNDMQEVADSRSLVKTPLCLTRRDVVDVIPSCVHPKELNLDWLNKITSSQPLPIWNYCKETQSWKEKTNC